MAARFACLLVAAVFAANLGPFAFARFYAEGLSCCTSLVGASAATAADHHPCPPPGGQTQACCQDCPASTPALMAGEATRGPVIARRQISTFPLVAWHAEQRVEEPPVPPPRGG